MKGFTPSPADKTAKIHEYIRMMATNDHVLSEYLRYQKPEKEQEKRKNHHERIGPCLHVPLTDRRRG